MPTVKSLIFLILLVMPFLTFFYQSREEIFILAQDNVCFEVWKGFNNDGVGYSAFENGKFRMWINDTSGGWSLSKISRGLMPHYWGLRYAPINEIEIKKTVNFLSSDIILEIDLKLIDYRNYTVSNSSMNVAIVLFFDGFITDYQEKCYQTEIQFFSYYGDRIQKDQEWYFTWRNDSVAQFKLSDNLQKDVFKHYKINLLPYIENMMNYYNLNHVKLKHIEIFTEAYKGYSEFEVYSAKIYLNRNLFSSSFIIFIITYYIFLSAYIILKKAKITSKR